MSDDLNTKYQQHYNQVLTGTLTDTLMKSISYQANIKLANEIISENEKIIQELKAGQDTSKKELQLTIDGLKKELETAKNNKINSENARIVNLENTIKSNQSNLSRLQSELFEVNKLKTEYENVKHQVQHLNTYRTEVVKANDTIKALKEEQDSTRSAYEQKIKALTDEINLLRTPQTPVKKAKVTKKSTTVTTPKAKIIKQEIPGLIVKDGGSF
jgi:chromosome segregation ATPase